VIAKVKRLADLLFRRQDFRVDGEQAARMTKWTLLSTPLGSVFFHHFIGADWTRDPHDHPTDFVSIGLRGYYVESVWDRSGTKLYERKWQAPWIRTFPATHIHRTEKVDPRGAYTLCLAGRWKNNWGFFLNGQQVTWRDYIRQFRSARSDR
jgi:hypothetical protein